MLSQMRQTYDTSLFYLIDSYVPIDLEFHSFYPPHFTGFCISHQNDFAIKLHAAEVIDNVSV